MPAMDNVTAYFAWPVSYLRKMLMKLTTGAVVIKLFFFVTATQENKLDRLSLAIFFRPCLQPFYFEWVCAQWACHRFSRFECGCGCMVCFIVLELV